jgi:Cu/Zn superoxide dismutase
VYAHCKIQGTEANPDATGTVTFTQDQNGGDVTMNVYVTGLSNTGMPHGVHIHEVTSTTNNL